MIATLAGLRGRSVSGESLPLVRRRSPHRNDRRAAKTRNGGNGRRSGRASTRAGVRPKLGWPDRPVAWLPGARFSPISRVHGRAIAVRWRKSGPPPRSKPRSNRGWSENDRGRRTTRAKEPITARLGVFLGKLALRPRFGGDRALSGYRAQDRASQGLSHGEANGGA